MQNQINHIPVKIRQDIKKTLLQLSSCFVSILLMLMSNQFNYFLYGVPLFASLSILFSTLFGLAMGICYFYCAIYEYKTNFIFSSVLKHLILIHVISFLALNVLKVFALFHFFPVAYLGISMLGSMFVLYNQFVKDYNKRTELDLSLQFLMSCFVLLLGVAYSSLCTYGLGIVIGFDFTIATFSSWCAVVWMILNCFGLELLSVEQQVVLSIFVFSIATIVLCICQLQLPSCFLYMMPAISYYTFSGWLSEQPLPKNIVNESDYMESSSITPKIIDNKINQSIVPPPHIKPNKIKPGIKGE